MIRTKYSSLSRRWSRSALSSSNRVKYSYWRQIVSDICKANSTFRSVAWLQIHRKCKKIFPGNVIACIRNSSCARMMRLSKKLQSQNTVVNSNNYSTPRLLKWTSWLISLKMGTLHVTWLKKKVWKMARKEIKRIRTCNLPKIWTVKWNWCLSTMIFMSIPDHPRNHEKTKIASACSIHLVAELPSPLCSSLRSYYRIRFKQPSLPKLLLMSSKIWKRLSHLRWVTLQTLLSRSRYTLRLCLKKRVSSQRR